MRAITKFKKIKAILDTGPIPPSEYFQQRIIDLAMEGCEWCRKQVKTQRGEDGMMRSWKDCESCMVRTRCEMLVEYSDMITANDTYKEGFWEQFQLFVDEQIRFLESL